MCFLLVMTKGSKHTDATREKMSGARKGRKRGPMSEAQKIKLRGRVFSEDHRRNLSLARRGKPLSDKQKSNMMGHPVSLETREKIASSLRERYKKRPKPRPAARMRAKPRPARLNVAAVRAAANKLKAPYVRTQEHSNNISKGKLGKKSPLIGFKHTAQSRANMSAAQRRRPPWKMSAEGIARSIASRKGVPKTEAWKQRVRDSRARKRLAQFTVIVGAIDDVLDLAPVKRIKLTRVKPSEETRANMREAAHRRFADPAERAKISKALTGKVRSEAAKAKQSKALKGKKKPPFTPEHCANISRALKARKLDK